MRLTSLPQFFDFIVGQMFYPDEIILYLADANEFVELDLNGRAVAVL